MRKYLLNENFFESIDSEAKAYFLGFLFADGYVNERLNMVDLTIHEKDKEVLDKFITHIYPEGRPLKIIRDIYLRLVINSPKLVSDLVAHGCFQAKTFKLKFPTISEEFQRDFIRGYFDGDGSIYISKDNTLHLSIVGTIDFLDGMKKILSEKCNLNNTVYEDRYPERNTNIRGMRFGGNILMNRIYHYMYDGSTLFLSRKRKIFLSILENKNYFCDINKNRNLVKHAVVFEGKEYNFSQLAKALSQKINRKSSTIRRNLYRGWSIGKIIEKSKFVSK